MPKAKKPQPQEYTVRGRGPFPIDMLRYDRATPATEQDSGAIIRTFSRERGIAAHEVRIVAPRITHARWQSFGYTVDDAPGTASLAAKHAERDEERRIEREQEDSGTLEERTARIEKWVDEIAEMRSAAPERYEEWTPMGARVNAASKRLLGEVLSDDQRERVEKCRAYVRRALGLRTPKAS